MSLNWPRLGMCVLIGRRRNGRAAQDDRNTYGHDRRGARGSIPVQSRRSPSSASAALGGATFAIRPRRPPLPAPPQARSVWLRSRLFRDLSAFSCHSIRFHSLPGGPSGLGKFGRGARRPLSGLFLKNYIKPQSAWQGIVGFSYQASPLAPAPTRPPSAPPPAPARRRSAI